MQRFNYQRSSRTIPERVLNQVFALGPCGPRCVFVLTWHWVVPRILLETSNKLENLKEPYRRCASPGVTQAIAGCSSEINDYLSEYSVAFYQFNYFFICSFFLLAVFIPNAIAGWSVRIIGTYTEPSALCKTAWNADTQDYRTWMCDTGRRHRIRTSNIGELLRLIWGL